MPAFLLPLLMGGSALANYLGARSAAGAARDAAATQAQSAREALALQGQLFAQTREDLSPYRTQGGQGLTALTSLLGLPAAPATASGTPPIPGQAAGAGIARGPLPPDRTPTGFATPRGFNPDLIGGANTMVLLRSPQGAYKVVPRAQADFYIARGATPANVQR